MAGSGETGGTGTGVIGDQCWIVLDRGRDRGRGDRGGITDNCNTVADIEIHDLYRLFNIIQIISHDAPLTINEL